MPPGWIRVYKEEFETTLATLSQWTVDETWFEDLVGTSAGWAVYTMRSLNSHSKSSPVRQNERPGKAELSLCGGGSKHSCCCSVITYCYHHHRRCRRRRHYKPPRRWPRKNSATRVVTNYAVASPTTPTRHRRRPSRRASCNRPGTVGRLESVGFKFQRR